MSGPRESPPPPFHPPPPAAPGSALPRPTSAAAVSASTSPPAASSPPSSASRGGCLPVTTALRSCRSAFAISAVSFAAICASLRTAYFVFVSFARAPHLSPSHSAYRWLRSLQWTLRTSGSPQNAPTTLSPWSFSRTNVRGASASASFTVCCASSHPLIGLSLSVKCVYTARRGTCQGLSGGRALRVPVQVDGDDRAGQRLLGRPPHGQAGGGLVGRAKGLTERV